MTKIRFTSMPLIAGSLILVLLGSAQAEIAIKVDKSTQEMTVLRDGDVLYTWPVSTGRTKYATPSGSYPAFRMEAEHYSKEWDDAPMPHSIFFTKFGHAIHGSYETKNIGSPVSHGCVRLSPAHAATLFAAVKQDGVTNTKVMVTGSEQAALGNVKNNLRMLGQAEEDQHARARFVTPKEASLQQQIFITPPH